MVISSAMVPFETASRPEPACCNLARRAGFWVMLLIWTFFAFPMVAEFEPWPDLPMALSEMSTALRRSADLPPELMMSIRARTESSSSLDDWASIVNAGDGASGWSRSGSGLSATTMSRISERPSSMSRSRIRSFFVSIVRLVYHR